MPKSGIDEVEARKEIERNSVTRSKEHRRCSIN